MTTQARDLAKSTILAEYRPVEDSIEVVREKRTGDDSVVAVRFEDQSGVPRRALLGVHVENGRWEQGGAFVGSARVTGDRDIWETWGGWGPATPSGRRTVIGGWIAEPAAARIRVTDPLGREVEDAVQNGVAILMWRGDLDVHGATAELLDAEGRVIRMSPMRHPR
jgi:hypothetical protein